MPTLKRMRLTNKRDATESLTGFHGGTCVAASRVRPGEEGNQDSAMALQISDQTSVLVVSDGAGGYNDGAFASKLIIDTLEKNIDVWSDLSDLRMPIIESIEACHAALGERATTCACTVVVAELQGNIARHYLVGDSSIYVLGQRGAVRLQSVPQSVVGYGIESGFLPEEAAQDHEERHIVLNLVGTGEMKIELGSPIELRPRDTILLCSDGLTDNLAQEDIIDSIRCGNLAKGLDQLMDGASRAMQLETGHPDDLTVIAWRPTPS